MKKLLIWSDFRYLLLAYEYDEESVQGPPYSVTEQQIRQLFDDFASISKLQEQPMNFDCRSDCRPNKFLGHHIQVSVYLLRNK